MRSPISAIRFNLVSPDHHEPEARAGAQDGSMIAPAAALIVQWRVQLQRAFLVLARRPKISRISQCGREPWCSGFSRLRCWIGDKPIHHTSSISCPVMSRRSLRLALRDRSRPDWLTADQRVRDRQIDGRARPTASSSGPPNRDDMIIRLRIGTAVAHTQIGPMTITRRFLCLCRPRTVGTPSRFGFQSDHSHRASSPPSNSWIGAPA